MRFHPALIIPAALLLTACDGKTLIVQSDTSWAGDIVGYSQVSGTGNAVIDVSSAPTNVCWTFRKTTTDGTLRVYLEDKTWFGLGTEVDGDATTGEPNGTVGGCNE